eukprot:6182233-Pleurochrysis_carterae.AAC.2
MRRRQPARISVLVQDAQSRKSVRRKLADYSSFTWLRERSLTPQTTSADTHLHCRIAKSAIVARAVVLKRQVGQLAQIRLCRVQLRAWRAHARLCVFKIL